MESLSEAHAVSSKSVMFSGRLFDSVLPSVSIASELEGRVHTPIGFATVRITREASLKVNDIESRRTLKVDIV